MQSLSHWDSEKVFCSKFFVWGYFLIRFLYYILQFFTQKTFFIKSLLKKNKQFHWFNVVNTSLPQKIPATPHKFKKKIPPKGLEKGHNGNKPNLGARKWWISAGRKALSITWFYSLSQIIIRIFIPRSLTNFWVPLV